MIHSVLQQLIHFCLALETDSQHVEAAGTRQPSSNPRRSSDPAPHWLIQRETDVNRKHHHWEYTVCWLHCEKWSNYCKLDKSIFQSIMISCSKPNRMTEKGNTLDVMLALRIPRILVLLVLLDIHTDKDNNKKNQKILGQFRTLAIFVKRFSFFVTGYLRNMDNYSPTPTQSISEGNAVQCAYLLLE